VVSAPGIKGNTSPRNVQRISIHHIGICVWSRARYVSTLLLGNIRGTDICMVADDEENNIRPSYRKGGRHGWRICRFEIRGMTVGPREHPLGNNH
jgi:hypothetical protein